jgi:hypothetical protein
MSKRNAFLFLFGSFGWLIGFALLLNFAGAPREGPVLHLLISVWLLVFVALFVTGSALWAGAKGYHPVVGAILG